MRSSGEKREGRRADGEEIANEPKVDAVREACAQVEGVDEAVAVRLAVQREQPMPVARGDRADRDAAHLLVRLVEPGRRQLPRPRVRTAGGRIRCSSSGRGRGAFRPAKSLDLVQAAENDLRTADAGLFRSLSFRSSKPRSGAHRPSRPQGSSTARPAPAAHEVTRAYVVTDDGRSRRLGGSSGNERAPVRREDSGRKREAALAGLDGERRSPPCRPSGRTKTRSVPGAAMDVEPHVDGGQPSASAVEGTGTRTSARSGRRRLMSSIRPARSWGSVGPLTTRPAYGPRAR